MKLRLIIEHCSQFWYVYNIVKQIGMENVKQWYMFWFIMLFRVSLKCVIVDKLNLLWHFIRVGLRMTKSDISPFVQNKADSKKSKARANNHSIHNCLSICHGLVRINGKAIFWSKANGISGLVIYHIAVDWKIGNWTWKALWLVKHRARGCFLNVDFTKCASALRCALRLVHVLICQGSMIRFSIIRAQLKMAPPVNWKVSKI